MAPDRCDGCASPPDGWPRACGCRFEPMTAALLELPTVSEAVDRAGGPTSPSRRLRRADVVGLVAVEPRAE